MAGILGFLALVQRFGRLIAACPIPVFPAFRLCFFGEGYLLEIRILCHVSCRLPSYNRGAVQRRAPVFLSSTSPHRPKAWSQSRRSRRAVHTPNRTFSRLPASGRWPRRSRRWLKHSCHVPSTQFATLYPLSLLHISMQMRLYLPPLLQVGVLPFRAPIACALLPSGIVVRLL